MKSDRLRPFEKREDRLFRNALAEGFMAAIAGGDISSLEDLAEKFRSAEIGAVMDAYLADRMDRYRAVFHGMIITEGSLDGVLRAGFILWDHGLFFEMHEWLEQHWKKSSGDEKKLLQALIRAAGARIHLEEGACDRAMSLSKKAAVIILELKENMPAGFNTDIFISDLESLDFSEAQPGRYASGN